MWAAVRGILRAGVRSQPRAGGSRWGLAQSSSSSGGEPGPGPGVEEVIRVEKQKRKAIKFRRIRAELGLSGPPPRSLMTEAMEQIRFLRTKFPEEWSMSQLAEGFSVSEDAIRRVLRSKFKPSLQRRMKQDANVCGARQTVPHGTKRLTANSPSAKALVESKPITDQAPLPRLFQGTVTLPAQPDLNSSLHKPIAKGTGRISLGQQSACTKFMVRSGSDKIKAGAAYVEREERNASDGEQLLGVQETDEELQKLTENQMKVVQKGYEFYDQEGNFLYRINNMDSLNNPKQET
ncbi:neugrin [Carcharodon carcharias]|uniref:neugrin n=1 Tax=Carcharodon carcharias TaxID=13397 RepID=UPI001B7E64E8|nr:neugrin [Carcharodon carcharias]